jgi:hypothetical protein
LATPDIAGQSNQFAHAKAGDILEKIQVATFETV